MAAITNGRVHMMFLPRFGAIKDDAGGRHKLLDPAGASEWPSKGDVRITALVHRVRVAMSARSSVESLFTVIAAIGVLVLYSLTRVSFSRLFPGAPGFVYFLVVLGAAIFVGRALWRARLHANRKQVARMILEEGLCPCCGYNFHGIPGLDQPPERLIACPECGAAWRRGRIERVRPFEVNDAMKPPGRLVAKRENPGSWCINDDRGGKFRLLSPHEFLHHTPVGGAGSPGVERARARVRRNGRWMRAIMTTVLLGAAAWIVIYTGSTGSLGLGFFAGAIFAGLALATSFCNFAYSPRRFKRDLTEQRLCPACGAGLARVAPSFDGCTVCPVCRAAWRLPTPEE